MPRTCLPLLAVSLLAGCAASPERVFRDATEAFARGDVDTATRHFSRRLLDRVSHGELEYYYSKKDNQRGVAFLLEDLAFQVVAMDDDRATARVVWRTGRTEPVHFVREQGAWRIDVPEPDVPEPSGETAAPTPAGTSG